MNQTSQQLQQLSECTNPGEGDGNGQGFGENAQWGSNGQYSEGNTDQFGKGSGGPGKGMGNSPDAAPTDFMLKKERAEVQTTNEGPVIASTMVQGSQIRGESTATFSSVVESASTQAAEARTSGAAILRHTRSSCKESQRRTDQTRRARQRRDRVFWFIEQSGIRLNEKHTQTVPRNDLYAGRWMLGLFEHRNAN